MSWTEEYNKSFPKMTQYLKPQETEHFKILHREVTEHEVKFAKLRDCMHGVGDNDGLKPGTYVNLVKKGKFSNETMMSDTWYEKWTNYELLQNAKGEVLIAGLGIGMVVLALQEKQEVTSITVVEKEQEIVDLVKNSLPLNEKVTIVCSDIFEYIPTQKFDTIWFDIWDNVCGDNWQEIVKL